MTQLTTKIWVNVIFIILTIGSSWLDRNGLFIIDHNIFVNVFEDVVGFMAPFAAAAKVDGENKCNNHRDAHHNSNNQERNRFWNWKKGELILEYWWNSNQSQTCLFYLLLFFLLKQQRLHYGFWILNSQAGIRIFVFTATAPYPHS